MRKDNIFEKYIDGITAFESGLATASQYILEDAFILAEKFNKQTERNHPCYLNILEALSRVYIFFKRYEDALLVLNKVVDVEPNNLRVLYRLFFFHLETLPNEKEALKVYLRAMELHRIKGDYDLNDELYKKFSSKGELIKKNRQSFLLMEESSKIKAIQQQNLMKQLPIEILSEIFSLLDNESLLTLLSVCKSWRVTILESPYLIGRYKFDHNLTYSSLEKYLRLFDQKAPLSEVILDKLTILSGDKASQQFKTFKLLLASKLQCKSLTYKIMDDFQAQLIKMIKDSNSHLFKNLIRLELDICEKYSSLFAIPAFLPFTTNLKSLVINIDLKYQNGSGGSLIFKNKIKLHKLQHLTIISKKNSYPLSTLNFEKYLDCPNVENVTLAACGLKLLLNLLEVLTKVKHLKLIKYSISDFMYLFTESSMNLEYLEKLEFENAGYHTLVRDIPIELIETKPFASLKTLSFNKSLVSSTELNCYINCSKRTLQNLFLVSVSGILYHRNGHNAMNVFNLKNVLESTTELDRFQLIDNRIDHSKFSALMMDIALLSKPIHLKYFEISSEILTSDTYLVLFLSIRGKLTIDHLKMYEKPNNQLKLFIDAAISDGSIKKVDYRLNTHRLYST